MALKLSLEERNPKEEDEEEEEEEEEEDEEEEDEEEELKNGGPIHVGFCRHYVSQSYKESTTALSNSVHN